MLTPAARQLRKFAKKKGLTAEDIAEHLRPRVERQTVIRWWDGIRRPDEIYRTQLSEISEGFIESAGWLTKAELRREEWLKQHTPVEPIAPEPTEPIEPSPGTLTITEEQELRIEFGEEGDGGKRELEIDFGDDEEEETPTEVVLEPDDEDAEPTEPKSELEPSPKLPKNLPKHYYCTPDDPVKRLQDRDRKRFEMVSSDGSVLDTLNDFVQAKQMLDQGLCKGAAGIRCVDCREFLARRSEPSEKATESTIRLAYRQKTSIEWSEK